MELRHLRYFVAVGKCLNFTKAAEMLHVSQPPLSRQIQELEEELGVALFDRTGKKTSLTEAGAFFLVEAERLLDGIEAAGKAARSIAEGARTLNIGCVNFYFNKSLAPHIEEIRRIIPVTQIEIRVMSTEAQERALLSGAIEIGFVRSWIQAPELAFDPVAEESLDLIYPSSMIELSKLSVSESIEKLARLPFIGMDRSMAVGLADMISKVCVGLGVSQKPAYECNDAYSIFGLVSSGLGWSIVPDLELTEFTKSGIGRIEIPEKIVIGMSYKKTGLSEQAQNFLTVAKSYLSSASLS
jgi:LysR family transcriptional regulator, benzoate and cis,cis-muconate-responsive activator of ben and cat genes